MEKFVKGDVVVIPFPFSDLTASKRRPALVAEHYLPILISVLYEYLLPIKH
jgi:hypothetical protein